MAIQPIDAQVLFSRLNQMGKEQAEQKDSQIHTQLVQGQEIVKRTEESDHKVTGTHETEGDDVLKLKDEARRRGQGKNSGAGEEASSPEEETETGKSPAQETIREAHLGTKIDITG